MALTTGVRQANTARISPSSENGNRSSSDPPPRAITITSVAGFASSVAYRLHQLSRRQRTLDQHVPGHDPDARANGGVRSPPRPARPRCRHR